MERILVGIDTKMTGLWSVIYALNLAKRMDVKISVLLVIKTQLMPDEKLKAKDALFIKTRLEELIMEGRSEGISIDYYVTHGSYKDELIKFIKEKKISLLVIDYPLSERKNFAEKLPELLGEIKLRTHCRIEIVHQKDIK